MYLATLSISNFRRLQSVKLEFQPGLNVIVGPNNIGKTAVVDALRALLAGADDPYPKFTRDDLHLPKGGAASGDITFEYVFRELSPEDEADFLHALRPGADDKLEAVLGVNYGDVDKAGRLRPRRWCGDYQDVGMASTMLENLRSVYLQPLRDAEQGLRPSRNSQLSRLLHLLSDDSGKEEIASELTKLDAAIKKLKPIVDTQNAIAGRHKTMLGDQLAQALNVELTGNDFQKLAARLSLLVDAFEIERNGLGYNNLIFMAVVLSELAKSADAAFRSLIVEESEAHLHPQLQAVLLRYLSSVESAAGEKACPSLCDYTHASARYWVLRTLKEEPFVLRALVRRYPHILVDEAQDIGPEHEAILELMVGAGSQLSLIGDSNQGMVLCEGA
jgi:putative ATP-dependent endonuclease of OLD family